MIYENNLLHISPILVETMYFKVMTWPLLTWGISLISKDNHNNVTHIILSNLTPAVFFSYALLAYISRARPKSHTLATSPSPRSTFLAARSLCVHYNTNSSYSHNISNWIMADYWQWLHCTSRQYSQVPHSNCVNVTVHSFLPYKNTKVWNVLPNY